jgi:hypothetical protein
MGMGFSIKTFSKSDLTWAAVMHALLGLIIPIFFLTMVGCTEEIFEEGPEVGAEVAEDTVLDAMYEAIGDHTPNTLVKGAFTLYERNMRVETSAVMKLEEVYTEILERDTESNTGYDTLLLQENSLDYQEENPLVVSKQVLWDVPKLPVTPNPPTAISRIYSNFANVSPITTFSNVSKSVMHTMAEPIRQSFHDLAQKTYTTNFEPCNGQPTCTLNVNEIKVSLVTWYDDTSFDKTDLTFRFSRDIPRIHRLEPPDSDPLGQITGAALSYCQTGKARQNGQSYFLNACWVLRDFGF